MRIFFKFISFYDKCTRVLFAIYCTYCSRYVEESSSNWLHFEGLSNHVRSYRKKNKLVAFEEKCENGPENVVGKRCDSDRGQRSGCRIPGTQTCSDLSQFLPSLLSKHFAGPGERVKEKEFNEPADGRKPENAVGCCCRKFVICFGNCDLHS